MNPKNYAISIRAVWGSERGASREWDPARIKKTPNLEKLQQLVWSTAMVVEVLSKKVNLKTNLLKVLDCTQKQQPKCKLRPRVLVALNRARAGL